MWALQLNDPTYIGPLALEPTTWPSHWRITCTGNQKTTRSRFHRSIETAKDEGVNFQTHTVKVLNSFQRRDGCSAKIVVFFILVSDDWDEWQYYDSYIYIFMYMAKNLGKMRRTPHMFAIQILWSNIKWKESEHQRWNLFLVWVSTSHVEFVVRNTCDVFDSVNFSIFSSLQLDFVYSRWDPL